MFLKALLPILLLSTPTLAGGTAEHSDTPDKTDKLKEKKICHRQVATGSFLPKRECHTKAEWDAMTEHSKEDVDRARDIDTGRWRSTGGAASAN